MDLGYERPAVEEELPLKFPTGAIVASLLAPWIGLMTLAIVNIAADVNSGFKTWITLHQGIGPYSGKELLLFITWFVSWPILHVVMRRRELNLKKWFGSFMVGMLVATVLMWPPVFEAIANLIKGA